MTKTNYFDKINTLVTNAKTAKQAYYTNLQEAITIFLTKYNKELGKNSTPLLSILLATGKEIQAMKKYLQLVSNISDYKLNENKTGLKIVWKKDSIQDKDSPLVIDSDLLKNNNWYDIAKLDAKKAVIADLTETRVVSRIKKLINDLQESSLENKQKYLDALSPLV